MRKTKQELDSLWQRYKKSKEPGARNALIEHYLPLVRYIADRLMTKLPHNVDVDDLNSAGVFGLMDAIDKFDPGRGFKFETYCTNRIRGAMLDELRSMDWVPRLIRARTHRLEKTYQSLQSKLGRDPEEAEVARALQLSIDQYRQIVKESSTTSLLSIHKNWTSDNAEEGTIQEGDLIVDYREGDPSRDLQRGELVDFMTHRLSSKERLVLLLYYYEDLTMKEIGETLELSESRVCQIHARVMARLKEEFCRKKAELL